MFAGFGVDGKAGNDGGMSVGWRGIRFGDCGWIFGDEGPGEGAIPEFDPSVTP